MASNKKTAKLQLHITHNQHIEGSKEKLFTVSLKKGGSKIEIGQFLAKSETDAKKKAKTAVRAAL